MNEIVLGTMNIEYPYSSNHDKSREYYKSIIEKYMCYNDRPILDTAYYYGNTKTEETLGKILPKLSKLPIMATKANPWFENDFTNGKLGQLSKEPLVHQITTSLTNLNLENVDVFYLHCPDHETPIENTLETCNDLWRKEKFNNLGISNFSKDQLQEVLDICEKNGYTTPKYYQGMYNIICRRVEEVFPILNDHDMVFWGYNPLAGGLLTGKYRNGIPEQPSRFTGNSIYQSIFWKPEILFDLNDFFTSPLCLEQSWQWLLNYSKLRTGIDKIIMGVSTIEQLEKNMEIIKDRVLYDSKTIEYLNGLYSRIENHSPNYYY